MPEAMRFFGVITDTARRQIGLPPIILQAIYVQLVDHRMESV